MTRPENIQDADAPLETYAKAYPHLVGIRGWFLVFVIGIMVSIAINFYASLVGFADRTEYTATVLATYPGLTTIISLRNIMQLVIALGGIWLLVMIFRRQKRAIRFAILYFSLILAFGVVSTAVNYMQFNSNSAVLAAAYKNDGPLRMIAYSSIWLAYFMSSRRVRATLGRGRSPLEDMTSSKHINAADPAVEPETSEHIEKLQAQLDELEKIAFGLDKGCRDGEVSDEEARKATEYVDLVGDGIIDSKAIDAEGYIVYEVQALLAWIKHDEVAARQLAQMAVDVKGDDVLFTQTANMILRS
jgi:hypothetical protein